jgi:replicative DNA helicase
MTDFLPPVDPQNEEAEIALVGAILIAPQYFRECNAIVGPGDFYDLGRGRVWGVFTELDRLAQPIDTLTVADCLDKSGCAVTASELVGYSNSVPFARNAVTYAEKVAECSGRRRLLAHASECARLAHDDATGFLDGLERAKGSLSAIPVAVKAQVSATDQLDSLTTEIEERMKDPKEVWGITSGFSDMDKRTGGYQKGEATIWCGAPGIGKSMAMGQMAYEGAKAGFSVDIYSLEMRYKQYYRRLISFVSGVDSRKMRTGYISDEEYAKIMEAASALSMLKLRIIDDSGMTLSQIRASIYKRRQDTGLDSVFIDYFGRIGYPTHDNELVRDDKLSNEIKTIADKEDVAVIVAHSMPKMGLESKVPEVQDASGNIKIIHNVDNAIFMVKHLPGDGEKFNAKIRTLLFAKARDLAGMPMMNIVQLHDRPGFGQIDKTSAPDYEWQTRDN